MANLLAVADLGALLRWSGLVRGPAPQSSAIVCPDALVAEVIEYLRVRHDDRVGSMLADLAGVEMAVDRFYPSGDMSATLAEVAARAPTDLDVALCSPVALAIKLGLPLVTTSSELAALAHPHVAEVTVLGR